MPGQPVGVTTILMLRHRFKQAPTVNALDESLADMYPDGLPVRGSQLYDTLMSLPERTYCPSPAELYAAGAPASPFRRQTAPPGLLLPCTYGRSASFTSCAAEMSGITVHGNIGFDSVVHRRPSNALLVKRHASVVLERPRLVRADDAALPKLSRSGSVHNMQLIKQRSFSMRQRSRSMLPTRAQRHRSLMYDREWAGDSPTFELFPAPTPGHQNTTMAAAEIAIESILKSLDESPERRSRSRSPMSLATMSSGSESDDLISNRIEVSL
ncbi:hypothetical protein PBRA_002764 [Plasmodiophora brassicae]|nr:hypothetical protein PBRA_002764 [Plasmodiophora brassicae]